MAISLRASGSYASGINNITPGIPAGAVSGDLMLLLVGTKPYNGTNVVPNDWTLIGEATDGTVAAGNDVGSMKVEAWYKVHTGTESDPLVTNSTNNVSGGIVIVFQNATGVWDVAGSGGGDDTAGTGFSVTAASNPGITADDMLCAFAAFRSDAANPGTPSITAASATISSVTKEPSTDLSTTSGGDMDMTTGYASVTAGTATAAPVYAVTLGGSHTGSAYIIRMREAPGEQTIAAPLVSDGDTLYEPSLYQDQSLTLPLLGGSLSDPVYDTDIAANTANSLSLTSVPAGSLLVLAVAQNDDGSVNPYCTVTSSPSLTWTTRAEAEASASGTSHIYTALFTAGGSITVTAEWGPITHAQCVAALYAIEGGSVGNTAAENGESAPQTSLTTAQDNAIVIGVVSDWNTVDGASRTYRRASTETVYDRQSGFATIYHFFRREPTAGTYDYGLSSPTGQSSGCAYIEVRQEVYSQDDVLYPPAFIGSGGESVTLPVINNANTLHGPTVVPGAVSITAPLVSDGDTLYEPAIVAGNATLSAPLINSTSNLYGPTLVPGAVSVAAPLLNNGNTLYGPTIIPGAVTLSVPLISNVSVLYEPTVVPGDAAIVIPLLNNTPVLYEPILVQDQFVVLPLFTSTPSLYGPTVVAGPVQIAAPLINNANSLFAPTVVKVPVPLSVPFVSDGDTLHLPSVVPGSVSISAPLLGNISVLYEPVISTGQVTVILPLISDGDTLHGPSIVPGSASIAAPLLNNASTLYAPSVQGSGGDGWAQDGTPLTIGGSDQPSIAALTSTRVAYIDGSTESLRAYDWNGTTWVLVGSGLSIPGIVDPAICAMSSTRVAFFEDTSDELRVYDFNGSTWSQVGNALVITSATAAWLTALSSTRIAFIDETNDSLRAYDFDGTNWSLVGSGLAVGGLDHSISALSSTRVAHRDSANDEIAAYDFNGSTWSLVGSKLEVVNAGAGGIAALNSTDIAYVDRVTLELRTYRFNGSTWSQVGTGLTMSGFLGNVGIAALSSSSVAYINGSAEQLTKYNLGSQPISVTLPLIPSGSALYAPAIVSEGALVLPLISNANTLHPPSVVPEGFGAQYYASPTGTGNGASTATPFKIADFWSVAQPGDTLWLMNGTYTGADSMILPPDGLNGALGQRITVKAINDGQVLVDGEGLRKPIQLYNNDYITIEGVNACNSGDPVSTSVSVVSLYYSNYCEIKRVCAWEATDGNTNIFGVHYGIYNLIEDCAGWGTARKVFSNSQGGDNTTFRRCFGRWEGCTAEGPKHTFALAYNSYNTIVENCVGTWDSLKMPESYELIDYYGNGVGTFFSGYEVQQPNGIFSHDGFDIQPDIANLQVLGCVAYLKNSQRYHNSFKLWAAPFAFEMKGIDLKKSISHIEPGSVHETDGIWNVNLASVGTNTENEVNGLKMVGGDRTHISNDWNPNNILSSATCTNLDIGLMKRYVNGVETTQNLWPWPMNQRIKDAMVIGGYDPVDVTKTVNTLCEDSITQTAQQWLDGDAPTRAALAPTLQAYNGYIDGIVDNLKPTPATTTTGKVTYQSFNNPDFAAAYPSHQFHYYVPTHYTPSEKIGLMIWLHGGGSWDATEIDHILEYELDDETLTSKSYPRTYTDTSDYILLTPIAPFGAIIPHPDHASRWDVPVTDQYLIDLITEMSTRYNIDFNKVVIAGYSMGGIGAFHAAVRLSDRVAAVMASAGSWKNGHFNALWNTPMYIIHGTNDAFYDPNTQTCRAHFTAVEYARHAKTLLDQAGNGSVLVEYPNGHSWDATGEAAWATFINGQTGWVTSKVRNPYAQKVTGINPWRTYYEGSNFNVTWYEDPSPHTLWVSIDTVGGGTISYPKALVTGSGGGCTSEAVFNDWGLSLTSEALNGARVDAEIINGIIEVTTYNADQFTLWLHPNMVSFDQDIPIRVNGVLGYYQPQPNLLTAMESYERRWDWEMIYHHKVTVVVSGTANVLLPLIQNQNTLFPPEVAVTGAAQVTLPLIGSESALFAPSVVASGDFVTLPLISDADTLHAPSIVAGAVSVSLPLIPGSSVLYPPYLPSRSATKIWNGSSYINADIHVKYQAGLVPRKFKIWDGNNWI